MENLDYSLFMLAMVQKTNPIALHYFDERLKADYKSDSSPVTIADRKIENILREEITKNFPHHGILGEEFGENKSDSDYCWVIDPIDGTKNFTAGIASFATLIALCKNDIPIMGCIAAPAMNKIWIGGKDLGARVNGVPIKTRDCQSLSAAWMGFTHYSMFDDKEWVKVQKIEKKSQVSILGNDAIAFALLAEGRLDLVIEKDLKPWDFCALAPIIEAAGGVVTDFSGGSINLHSDGSIITAANESLYEQVFALMA